MSRLEDRSREVVSSESLIEQLSAEMVVELCKELVGEPPAAMLESRREMLRLLIESIPVESLSAINARILSLRFGKKAQY
jgi:hypothetical protein